MREYARSLLGVALLSLCAVAFSFTSAESHSWYPAACCSGYDCGEIVDLKRLPDGSMLITNEHGDTAVFPKGFHIQEPQDGKRHACISKYGKQPICLYLPAEI